MRKNVLSTLVIIILLLSMTNLSHAFDIDETVDDEIRKNYNPTKLMDDVGIKDSALNKKMQSIPEESLPELPGIAKQKNEVKSSNVKSIPTQAIVYRGGNVKVKKGTCFNVSNAAAISDWQREGTKVKFATNVAQSGKKYILPASTVFYGEIVESHQPQITCNGGLVAIKVYSMIYKGQTIPINAYITRANDKKIFLNNIKGDRTYLKTMWKKGNWGRNIFNRMLTLTLNLGGEGSTLILSPFPFAYGSVCLGLNTLTSPICAFFSKGGHVSIPAGSAFQIKLEEDVFIN